jgi:hypothetical protein
MVVVKYLNITKKILKIKIRIDKKMSMKRNKFPKQLRDKKRRFLHEE